MQGTTLTPLPSLRGPPHVLRGPGHELRGTPSVLSRGPVGSSFLSEGASGPSIRVQGTLSRTQGPSLTRASSLVPWGPQLSKGARRLRAVANWFAPHLKIPFAATDGWYGIHNRSRTLYASAEQEISMTFMWFEWICHVAAANANTPISQSYD